MQVDQPTPYTRARYDTSSEQPHAPQSYSFPPPPSLSRTASATDDHPSTSREYAPRPQSSEGNFSYAAPPPGHHHSYQSYSNSSESQQPRTLAGFADVDEGLFPRSVASGGGGPGGRPESTQANPGEYSQLGRTVVQGGNVGRTLNSYQFAGYMSGDDAGGSQFQPHPRQQQPQQHQSPYAQPQPHPQQYSRYQPFSTSAPGPPSYAIGRGPAFVSALNGAPLEWAKPRMSQDDSAIGLVSSHRFGASSSSTPSHTSRSGFATPGAAAAPQPHSHSYYSPYQGPPGSSFGMVRSTSNQSTISESTTASSSHLSTPGELTSDYEGHDINPSYLGQGYFANVGGAGGGDSGYYSSNDVHGVSGLRLDGVSPVSTPRNRSPARTSSGRASSSRTVRASSTSSTARNAGTSFATANGHKEPKRRTASTIFHPSPQSMLAPGATSPSAGSLASLKGRGLAHFPGTNSPALPTDEEFASMPTKRSRGRRPPCTPDLDINLEAVVDPNEEPTEAQLAYAGVTKTGKAKKIFLCKVPGCGKCFKRSEHLKRHVRSIHTHERPFQCQWPGCARYFSRHDNLNQHLRIHREPGVSDEAFSAELKRHFERRLTQVQQEVAQAQSRSPSVGAGEYEGGEEGMGAGAGGEEEHELVEERKPAPRKRSTRSRSRSMRVRDDNSDGEGDDEDDGDYVPGE